MKIEQNTLILYTIFARKIPFHDFFGDGEIPASKAETESDRTIDPNTVPSDQLRDHSGHRSKGAIVLNKQFMRIAPPYINYSISLDA